MAIVRTSGLNRKQRKELARRLRADDPGLEVMHAHAAGIDVGNSAHDVAVRPDRDPDSLEQHLMGVADKVADTPGEGEPFPTTPRERRRSGPKRRRKAGSHAPRFDLGRELCRISGVDLTRIDGIDVGVAQTVISEVGVDMTRWKTEAHVASWLGLCPDNRITGGKVIRKGTRRGVNRAATALRLAATTLLRSQSYLGAQYRRLRGKLGAPKAITAMAHKLARLVYQLLKWGHEYVDQGLEYYEARHREQQVKLLKKRAAKLGLQIVEPEAA